MKTKITGSDASLSIQICGNIDENAKETLQQLATQCGDSSKPLHFDFTELGFVNSCGVREWATFLRALPQDMQVRYNHCSEEFIAQALLVPGFLGQGTVESISREFTCPDCTNEFKVPYVRGQDFEYGALPAAKAVECPKCKAPYEDLSDEDEDYFQFLLPD
jgi:hypothetical protein